MASNIIGELSSANIIKIDIDFDMQKMMNISGRAAHIQFLENRKFMQVLIARYYEIFS